MLLTLPEGRSGSGCPHNRTEGPPRRVFGLATRNSRLTPMAADPGKPPDLGTGMVAASFGHDGSWLSIGCLHPRLGFVELNGLPPFDEARRGNPAATRRYRALLTDPRQAWLRVEPDPLDAAQPLVVATDDPDVVAWHRPGSAEPDVVAFGTPGSRRLTQRWQLAGDVAWMVCVSGRLDRPPLAEITEVNPPTPTGAVTELHAAGTRLVIRALALPAVATVDVSEGSWAIADGVAQLRVRPGSRSLDISVTLTPSAGPPAAVSATEHDLDRPVPGRPTADWIDRLVSRALTYVRGCTALALGSGERAILTDHRLLPLSWTRDAYYQALLLIANGSPSDLALVGDHLRWLWRRCERPDGRWMRSHHGNGAPKDLAFQADQQLYPFVELADLWRATGSLPDGVDWERVVPDAWRAVLAEIDSATGLVGTEENAADDRIAAAFTAGSQILLWYTAMRLAEPALASRIGLAADSLLAIADDVQRAFGRHFVIGDRWAYAVDGRGGVVDYHDANDLPTALAPVWGFCPADDPGWLGTMAFAFSPANHGFVDGPDGGLGSRHTPGAWPLGHIQAWLVSRAVGDSAATTAALDRLLRAAFADGMLPEARVIDHGESFAIRHWFAWPGAALGAFVLLDRRVAWDAVRVLQPGGDHCPSP